MASKIDISTRSAEAEMSEDKNEQDEPKSEIKLNIFDSDESENVNTAPSASVNVKKFKKRGRQSEDAADDHSRTSKITKISTSGWIETVTFIPVTGCPPQCPDCPPESLSPSEV